MIAMRKALPFAAPLALFVLVSVVFCLPVFQDFANWGHNDWDQFLYFNAVPRITLLDYHQFPLWNPFGNGGNLMLGHPHSSFLHPLFILVLLFGPLAGLKLQIAAHMILGMLGMYALSRHFRLGKISSFLPSFVFMLSSVYSLHMSEGHASWMPLVYLPWLLFFYEKSLKERAFSLGAGLVLTLMHFAGSVHALEISVLFLTVYASALCVERRSRGPLWSLLLSLGSAACFSAVKLFPMLDLFRRRPRLMSDPDGVGPGLLFKMLLSRKQESFLLNRPGTPWGWHEYGAYVGVVPAALAAAGAWFQRRSRWPLFAAGGVCLLIAMGSASPVDLWSFIHHFPVYRSLRVPSRYILGVVFTVSIFAGMGLSVLEERAASRRRGPARRNRLMILAGAALVLVDLWAVNSPLLSHAFTQEPFAIERHDEFRVRYDRFHPEGFESYSAMYPVVLGNSGMKRAYEVLRLKRGRIRAVGDPGYRGEAYLAHGEGTVSIASFSPNVIVADVDAEKAGRVVLNRNFHPGWRVRAGNGRRRAQRFRGLLSARVPEGRSRVVFDFRPASFFWGLCVSGISFILLLLRPFLGPLRRTALWKGAVRSLGRIKPKRARNAEARAGGAGLLKWAAYLLYLLLILLAVDFCFYRVYLRRISAPAPNDDRMKSVEGVSAKTMRRLGWLEVDKVSAFVNFPKKKRKGVVRIGCVGDSFTYGTEVERDEDYPSLLQKLFRERGYPNVEVLNFASGWYGFQQAYILWNEVARGYDLDYVLLGPRNFFPGRDTTFDHSSPTVRYYLHARHVLDGGGLRLLDVRGKTPSERALKYDAFLPSWRYLRYDRRAPAFLRSLLPQGRELANPFYYHGGDFGAEAYEIYARLLNRMADTGVQIVLGHYQEPIVRLARGLGRENLYAAKLEEEHTHPYLAPKNHNSPAGNRLLAEQFFAILTHREDVSLPLVKMRPLRTAPKGIRVPARRLCEYRGIGVEWEGGPPWSFIGIKGGTYVRKVPAGYFAGRKTHSLLALTMPGRTFSEAAFAPVDSDLRDGAPLTARVYKERGTEDVRIGVLRLLVPGLNVGAVSLGDVFDPAYPTFRNERAVFLVKEEFRRRLRSRDPVEILLDGEPVLRFGVWEKGRRIGLAPVGHKFFKLYPPAALLGGKAGAASGRLNLVLRPASGEDTVVPIARWKTRRRRLEASFPEPITIPPVPKPGR